MNHQNFPLNQYCLLQTRDFSELERFLVSMKLKIDAPLKVLKRPKVDSIINAFHLPHTCISFLKFPPASELTANSDYPFFNISLPISGSFTLRVANEEIIGSRRIGGIVSPLYKKSLVLHKNNGRYNLSFDQHSVVNILESMLGKPLSEPLCFNPKLELSTSGGKELKSLVNLMISDADKDVQTFSNSFVSTHFEQLLISILLTTQPHNYSQALSTPLPSPASHDVKRVIDYIQAHLDEPITLDTLITIGGVPGRSLFTHFRSFTGRSPLQYVAEQRLVKARQDLLNRENENTVTEIAARWGFNQLGRFSGHYKKMYGELPSETLKRVRYSANNSCRIY